jgi:hypothetical protein
VKEGFESIVIDGLPDALVKESKERVTAGYSQRGKEADKQVGFRAEKIGNKLEFLKERADLHLEAVVSHYMKHRDGSFVSVNRYWRPN